MLKNHLLQVKKTKRKFGHRWREKQWKIFYFTPCSLPYAKTHSVSCQTSNTEPFADIANDSGHSADIVNDFRKTLHLRCLTGFWIRLWERIDALHIILRVKLHRLRGAEKLEIYFSTKCKNVCLQPCNLNCTLVLHCTKN